MSQQEERRMSERVAGKSKGDDPGAAGAPFRDLFIELPPTLFEVLQGIGETSVKGAAPQPRRWREPALLVFLRNHEARRIIAECYGWMEIDEPVVTADVGTVDLLVTRACGHRERWRLDGRLFSDSLQSTEAVCELDRMLLRHHERGRRCSCILQQEATTR